tara:strand:- start:5192 stop:5353 length:162 start_codon:yes stop_codon:yes gene_type:complete
MPIGRAQISKQISKAPQKKKWSKKRKAKIDCKKPRGFSEKAHCAARKKRARSR